VVTSPLARNAEHVITINDGACAISTLGMTEKNPLRAGRPRSIASRTPDDTRLLAGAAAKRFRWSVRRAGKVERC
jgi:hypothetical protein